MRLGDLQTEKTEVHSTCTFQHLVNVAENVSHSEKKLQVL
jgi:hypothetical protein